MITEQQKQSFLDKLKELNVDITEHYITDENLESLIKIIQDNRNITYIKNIFNIDNNETSSELIKFVNNIDIVDDISILIKNENPSNNTQNIFSDEIFTYNIVEEKDKFLDTFICTLL